MKIITNPKHYITSKWKRITILIILYTIVLTVFFDDSDFTGILAIDNTVNEIKETTEGEKPQPSHRQLVASLLDMIIERFTFVVITISSVGYGDVVPKSRRLRLVNSFFILLFVYVIYND